MWNDDGGKDEADEGCADTAKYKIESRLGFGRKGENIAIRCEKILSV